MIVSVHIIKFFIDFLIRVPINFITHFIVRFMVCVKEMLNICVGKIFHKKQNALGDMLVCMMTILFMFIVLYICIDVYSQVNIAIEKTRIERKYIFAMETEGYLTPEKEAELLNELSNLGVTDISLEGTSKSPVGYSEKIVLCVNGKLNVSGKYGISENWQWLEGDKKIEFGIKQESTSKY